jgi:hypothetical protein
MMMNDTTKKRLIWDEDAQHRLVALAVKRKSDFIPLDMITYILFNESPTVDAVEVVHGRWKSIPASTPDGWKNSRTGEQVYPMYCSVCGDAYMNGPYKYCPSCGACMDLQ